jgi:ssDNA-binding Zn-finger/Zn-ribbon topoisomerase 1
MEGAGMKCENCGHAIAPIDEPGDVHFQRVLVGDCLDCPACDHQSGQHRTQRRPEACPSCAYTLRLARKWQASDSTFRDRDISDDDIVSRYLFHAQKMSES